MLRQLCVEVSRSDLRHALVSSDTLLDRCYCFDWLTFSKDIEIVDAYTRSPASDAEHRGAVQ